MSNQIHLNRISRKLTPTEIITIPVVVHVIHNNSSGIIGGTNISDEQILSQIKVLNEDYRKKYSLEVTIPILQELIPK